MNSTADIKRRATFATTQWTRVLQARGDSSEARAALGDLCEAYYAPVFAFVRRDASEEEKARDLTQEFFARLLQRDAFSKLDPARGRFRSYLLGAVKHFLSDMRRREAAGIRNPGTPIESLQFDTASTNAEAQIADSHVTAPDVEFDRKWALTLLDRALTLLAEEHKTEDKARIFEKLKPWLTGDFEGQTQHSAAEALGMTDTAVKVAIHRLRRRFRDLLKEQIAATLPEPDIALVNDEMSYLVSVLRS